MPTLAIEPLGRSHRRLVSEFRNQHPGLVEYLRRYALRHTERDHLSRTFVAIHTLPEGQRRVAGYFSLAAASLERMAADSVRTLRDLPRYPLPGVLLARLAVDPRAQGQGLGRFLFEEALGLTLQLARTGPVAFRVLVTDAVDERAARFYERFGLERLSGTFPARMVLDLKPLLGGPE